VGGSNFFIFFMIHCWLLFLGRFGIGVGITCGICGLSVGTLDEGHLDVELANGVKLGCIELEFEEEPEITTIKDLRKNQKVRLRMNKIFMHFATVIS
jgi:hypothetical protein